MQNPLVRKPSAKQRGFLLDVSAVALLVGTAVGGGFLALPCTVVPAGFLPSAVVMVGIWLFLFTETVIIADLVVQASMQGSKTPSFGSLARRALGPVGSSVVSVLFYILMLATLGAQITKGGHVLSDTSGLPVTACSLALSASFWLFTARGPAQCVNTVNTALTFGFILALSVMFAIGLPLVNWSQLAHTNWSLCWQSVPSMLQVFCYCQVVPTICKMLSFDRARIRRSILGGSLVLLALMVSWSALGLGLSQLSGAAVVSIDPVTRLLGVGGPIAATLLVLTMCAVATTLIGMDLAMQDFIAGGNLKWKQRLACSALVVLAPVLLAQSSPNAFFAVIDLSGAYPLALLWGCIPPLIAMRLRGSTRPGHLRNSILRRPLLLLSLFAFSAAFVCFNATKDLSSALGLGSASRWGLG